MYYYHPEQLTLASGYRAERRRKGEIVELPAEDEHLMSICRASGCGFETKRRCIIRRYHGSLSSGRRDASREMASPMTSFFTSPFRVPDCLLAHSP